MVNEVAGQLWQYADNLSSSCISAVERLSKKIQKPVRKTVQKKWIGLTAHLYGLVSQLLGENMPLLKRVGTYHKAPCIFTCMTMERT